MRADIANLPQRGLMALVRGYRLLLSPGMRSACRFEPSCSAYALQALDQHGAAAGTYLTLRRLARCQPFCAAGCDPVPSDPPVLFRLSRRGRHDPAGTVSSTSTAKPIP